MDILVWIAIIVFFVYRRSKKNEENQPNINVGRNQGKATVTMEKAGRILQEEVKKTLDTYANQSRSGEQKSPIAQEMLERIQKPQREITEEERAKLEAYRRKQAKKADKKQADLKVGRETASKKSEQMGEQKAGIMERVSKNVAKYENDTTLEELEMSHNHKEKSLSAIDKSAHQKEHALHPQDAAHVAEVVAEESASILGGIEDLMIKGYSGRLSFERDFVGEGMDMISHFTVNDTVPDFDHI